MDQRTVGLLGGGQLGRMLIEAAHRLNIKVVVLDAEDAPAKQINSRHQHINGSFTDPASIRKLAEQCDILTCEIEHVDTKVLEEIAEDGVEVRNDGVDEVLARRKVEVHPHWRTLRIIQDKYLQKKHLLSQDVLTAESIPLEANTHAEIRQAVDELGLPCMLKSRTQAYDGRGNFPILTIEDIVSALQILGQRPLYVERWANFRSELAVMVVKTAEDSATGGDELWRQTTLAYPTVETIHEQSICKLVYAPARNITPKIREQAQTLARKAVASFWGKGIFGVEMFLLEDDTLMVNEIAPRPHNSGHYTIEACAISQFDAHLRTILGLPFPPASSSVDAFSTSSSGLSLITPDTHALMLNLLGGSEKDSHLQVAKLVMTTPGARLHLYGKGDARMGRKMGHVTIVAGSLSEAERLMQPLIQAVDNVRLGRAIRSWQPTAADTSSISQDKVESQRNSSRPLVTVTMGSDSDLPVLKPGIALLADLGIAYEVTITSAHRTPGRMFEFAQQAASRGIKVIIAAAGGAAHLPGMIASSTPLPVIGVPVKGSTLDGMDSLLSIVQMPRGVPVATVSINNSINAALLAARILGTSDGQMQKRLEQYAADMESGVMTKVLKLDRDGWREYTP